MTVPSPQFLAFVALAAVLSSAGRGMAWRQGVLLAANLVFLSGFAQDPRAFLPLAGFLALGYAAQSIATGPRTVAFLIGATVLVFAWLKRYSFIPAPLFLATPYLLVGLSYIFFRVLHVIIDRHQGAIAERVGPVSYLNYTLNFCALVSGPIQRYEDHRRMECERLPLTLPIAGRALERVVIGTFKVVIVSLILSRWQHAATDRLAAGGGIADGVLAAGLYPIYLYANFSGYTDVVIGAARFLRIELPENFDRPFLAPNVITFWNRWHMTLSGWLKTYVFNPLMLAAMRRVTNPARAPLVSVFAFFVTFFLVGLWHGSTSAFIVFGILTGGGVAANKMWQLVLQQRLGRAGARALAAHPIYEACCRGLNATWFAFTLLWFWSDGGQIAAAARALGWRQALLVWPAIFACATPLLALLAWFSGPVAAAAPALRSRYLRTAAGTALTLVTVAVVLLLHTPAPDIVYKQF